MVKYERQHPRSKLKHTTGPRPSMAAEGMQTSMLDAWHGSQCGSTGSHGLTGEPVLGVVVSTEEPCKRQGRKSLPVQSGLCQIQLKPRGCLDSWGTHGGHNSKPLVTLHPQPRRRQQCQATFSFSYSSGPQPRARCHP